MEENHSEAYEALIQFLYVSPIGLAQINAQGDIEMINPMSAQLLMPLSKSGDLDNLFVVLEEVAPEVRGKVAGYEEPLGVVCDSLRIRLEAKAGRREQLQVLSLSVLKLGANRLMAVVNDVTGEWQREQQGMLRRLNDAARIDALTRLPNRTAIQEFVQNVIARSRAGGASDFAVIFLNCDRFKQINDTLGHTAGDKTLGLIADRLRSALRPYDHVGRDTVDNHMAARIGGDEFVVVLDQLGRSDDAHAVAARLIDTLDKPYGIGPHQIRCSASMGVVLGAQADGDADDILQDASIAMAEAKQQGGGRYAVFEPAMKERAVRRGNAEVELRQALVGGEFFVVYQPVIDLQGTSGLERSAGVEALVRWRHPTRGIVPPLEFIGLAEECGLISAIGTYVLETACHQMAAWRRRLGVLAPRNLAVNLSRAQLADAELVGQVDRILRSTGMQPQNLQLEVTESLAAQDESVQARLAELRALGLTLALDDFGTGYSSLASLHLLPVGTVKIDRSFVSQAATSRHHRVLIEATVRVAQSLEMKTVAEGIETVEQAQIVRSLGCDKGQGYLFSRPIDALEIEQWLRGEHDEQAHVPRRYDGTAGHAMSTLEPSLQ